MDEPKLYPWQQAFADMIHFLDEHDPPLVVMPQRGWGKTRAMQEMRARNPSIIVLDSISSRGRFKIYDELDLVGDVMGSIEKLERDRSWDARKQKPPEQIEQKKRPGVVMMRDRTGKMVERKL